MWSFVFISLEWAWLMQKHEKGVLSAEEKLALHSFEEQQSRE